MATTRERSSDLVEARALYETTQEICSRLDLDQVLSAIVRRARVMLGTDVAYLAVCDDGERVLRMTATDEIRGERFRRLVFAYGIGLGGRIAALRRPVSTEDYVADGSIVHDAEIDAAASEEGLRAALGVPVEFEGQLLGVLFVAFRKPGDFTPRQTTLLQSLGNSAAIAIHNAQVHGRLQRVLAIHDRLIQLALADRGLGALAEALASLVQAPVLLLDWSARSLAAAAFAGRRVSAPDATVLVGERPPQEGVEVLPVRIAGSVEGYLVVEGAVGRDELRRVAVEQAATVFALELAKIRSAEQAELQLRGDLLEELFGESLVDEGSVERRAARLGLDVREPHTVLVARTLEAEPGDGQSARVRRRLLQVAASLSRREAPGGIVAWKNDAVVLVAPGSSAEAALALGRRFAVEGRAAASQTVVVGIGGACSAPADYARSFQEAGRAADAGRRLPRLGTVVPYTSLDFHQLVLGTRPAEDLRRMAQTLLEPLLGGGSRAGSLLPTVRAYLAAGGNLEAASRALGIHVNTLRHRVNRISKLLGRDLASLRTRIDLHLAIEVLGDVSSDGQELRRGQQA